MTEGPNGREIYELFTELKVELGIINTKVDYYSDTKQKAEEAITTAVQAKQIAEENREDIRDMKANSKWLWGTILTFAAIMVSIGISIFN